MLRIKDDVDLKELEKFGFEIYKTNLLRYKNETEYWFHSKGIEIKGTGKKRGEISSPHYMSHSKDMFDVIYNLIEAGLVEKVDDDK